MKEEKDIGRLIKCVLGTVYKDVKTRHLTNYHLILKLYAILIQRRPGNMIKTRGSSVFICLALLACICHQTFSSESTTLTHRFQCDMLGYAGHCDFPHGDEGVEYDCKNLRCALYVPELYEDNRTYKEVKIEGVANGTYCGPSRFCWGGECVYASEESQTIPYSDHEPDQGKKCIQ